jgi:hypothetical protein
MKRFALVLILGLCACGSVGRVAGAPSPPPAPPLSRADLQYRLVDTLGAPVYCDQSMTPIVRGDDPAVAANRVAALRAQDPDELDAIVRHEHLDAASLSAADDVHILSQASLLAAVPLSAQGPLYSFAYEIAGAPPVEVRGTIDHRGGVTVTSRTAGGRRLCPL